MNRLFLLAAGLLVAAPQLRAQNPAINNHNYYEYYAKPTPGSKLKGRQLLTSWLKPEDVTLVLQEELTKAGHEWAVGNQLYRVDSMQYVVLSAYSQKTGVGIFYSGGHTAFPLPTHRQERGRDLGGTRGHVDHVQMIAGPGKQQRYTDIKQLPPNVLVLAENWYWYQQTDNPADNKHLVTREDILRVLRQDVQEKLAAMAQR